MEILEGNKLIAEFMGFKTTMHTPKEVSRVHGKTTVEVCLYHESWDWLMPVVEKIKNSGRYYDKHYIHDKGSKPSELIDTIDISLFSIDIESAFKYSVIFIKWYNENLKPSK